MVDCERPPLVYPAARILMLIVLELLPLFSLAVGLALLAFTNARITEHTVASRALTWFSYALVAGFAGGGFGWFLSGHRWLGFAVLALHVTSLALTGGLILLALDLAFSSTIIAWPFQVALGIAFFLSIGAAVLLPICSVGWLALSLQPRGCRARPTRTAQQQVH